LPWSGFVVPQMTFLASSEHLLDQKLQRPAEVKTIATFFRASVGPKELLPPVEPKSTKLNRSNTIS
jgi:hypothetical protein